MATKKPHRADDKRKGGYGDNQVFTVSINDGAGKPLAVFNDRRKKTTGSGKRAF